MSGIAIVLPSPTNFSTDKIGQVTFQEDVDVTAISLNCENSYSGIIADLSQSVSYTPARTSQKGVTFSITSGSSYASITNKGVLTILSGADDDDVTIEITSSYDNTVTATKTISVTYELTFPVTIPFSDDDLKRGNISGTTWRNLSSNTYHHLLIPVTDFQGHKIKMVWNSNPGSGMIGWALIKTIEGRTEAGQVSYATPVSGSASGNYSTSGVTVDIPSDCAYVFVGASINGLASTASIKSIEILE